MDTGDAVAGQRTNRLVHERSPYLLQHKNNPVDWYPWGEEAFNKAVESDKPIFLSIGYSTCHWCHVMAHESFEDPEVAKVMNELFVNIKVDREERPDVDKVYMTFLQRTSGGGGWPLSVWLTPDLKPLIAGTYFPPKGAYGRPGFRDILVHVSKMWRQQREAMQQQGDHILQQLQETEEQTRALHAFAPSQHPLIKCYQQLKQGFDARLGGFSKAPKFPRPAVFSLLHRLSDPTGPVRVLAHPPEVGADAFRMAAFTLERLAHGGVYDHLAGGYHRYSVTEDWHVPHFEKMLYDQAQMVIAHLESHQLQPNRLFAQRAREVLEYVMRDMTSPEGGFYSAEDADSLLQHGRPEHAEGAFYVWDAQEIRDVLGADYEVFSYAYDVHQHGNVSDGDPHGEFTGKNILIMRHTFSAVAEKYGKTQEQMEQLLSECRGKLLVKRNTRPRSHLDDKIITAWNGLMISAFVRGYVVLREDRYRAAAVQATNFLRSQLWKESTKTLIRNYCGKPSNVNGFLEDYVFLIQALLDLYEVTFDLSFLRWAIELQGRQRELFYDEEGGGGYFNTSEGDSSIVMRFKEDHDGAEPSPNSMAAMNLLRLGHLLEEKTYLEDGMDVFRFFSREISHHPIMMPQMCSAMETALRAPVHVVLEFPDTATQQEVAEVCFAVHARYQPGKYVVGLTSGESRTFFKAKLPFTQDMKVLEGKPTAYVCKNFACQQPLTDLKQLEEAVV